MYGIVNDKGKALSTTVSKMLTGIQIPKLKTFERLHQYHSKKGSL